MNYLALVDRFNPVPADWNVTLCEIQGKLLEEQACRHCTMMLDKALEEGIEIKVISAYRTPEYQQILWNLGVAELINSGYTRADAVVEVGKTLALPGHSEHNLGLAVDLGTEDAEDTQDYFYKTVQGKWLCKNAADYGFILRYPRLKEYITGISYEPWHYRYVGGESARIIKESGLCLEEFLHFYSEKYI